MSLWGALGGLGDGMQTVGTQISKSALAEKLEKQREERADARQLAKEERDANKVMGQRVVRDPDGTTWVQGINSAGQSRGERTLASEQEIRDYNLGEKSKENKASIEALTLLNAERTAADYDLDKDLKKRYTEAQIAQMGDSSARGWASIDVARQNADSQTAYRQGSIEARMAGKTGADGDAQAAASDYIKDNKALFDKYMQPEDKGGKGYTPNEVLQIVTRSLQTASEQGKNLDQTIFGALDAYPAARKQIDLRNAQQK